MRYWCCWKFGCQSIQSNFKNYWNKVYNIAWNLDASVCDNKQLWNSDKCGCECKEVVDNGRCDKGFTWSPSNCECECENHVLYMCI